MRVAIVIFEDVDLLDVGGPYEVFLTASRLVARRDEPPPFEVVTVGLTLEPIAAYGGMSLIPHTTFDRLGDVDVLVVPGAIAIDDVVTREGLVDAIGEVARAGTLTTSVCTGAFLLAEIGSLDDVPFTTHWEDLRLLEEALGSSGDAERHWVDAGEVVTSGGLSSGIAMALHLVDRLTDRDLAIATARQIDYAWDPDGHRISS